MTESRHVDVASYVLGVLDTEDHEEFERHLLDCPLCRIELTELQAAASALDILRASEGAGGGVDEPVPVPAAPVRPTRRVPPTWRRRVMVAAAAAFVLVLGAMFAASSPESAPNLAGPPPVGDENTVAAEEPTALAATPSADPTSRSSTLVSGADDGEDEEDAEEDEEDGPGISAGDDDEPDLTSRNPNAGITVDYTMQSWSHNHFGGDLTITNGSSQRLDDWEVEISFDRAYVFHAWDMGWDRTRDGARLYPADWENGIAPGDTRTLSFTAGGWAQTPRCTINGRSCGL